MTGTNEPVFDPLNRQYYVSNGWTTNVTSSWVPAANVKVENKEQVVALINARIADLAQKAARLSRLREFFETMSSNQNEIIREFWETVKKELD